MDRFLFTDILEKTLVPFIEDVYPDHRFMQDNDPKRTSVHARNFHFTKPNQLVENTCRITRPKSYREHVA